MIGFKKFWEGIAVVAKSVLVSDTKGELEVEDSSGKLNYHNGTSRSPIVTEAHTATLENKTIDADDNTINVSAVGLTATELNDALQELVDDIGDVSSDKISGPASSTDNAVVRFDGVTGKVAQNSLVTIDDSGVVSGATQLNVDNVRLDGNTISVTNSNGDLNINANGTGNVAVSAVRFDVSQGFAARMGQTSTSGSNVALVIDQMKNCRIVNTALDSIDTITFSVGTPLNGQELTFYNVSGSSVTLNNQTGAATDYQILTSSGGNVVLDNGCQITLVYNDIENYWMAGTVFKGPASSTDNAVPRFDGTDGQKLQESGVTINDLDEINGATSIQVGNINLSGNTIANTDGTDLILAPDVGEKVSVTGAIQMDEQVGYAITTDSTTTGSNASLTPTSKIHVFTNSSLVSLQTISTAIVEGQELTLLNLTGNNVTIINEAGSNPNRIKTGTGGNITLKNDASIGLVRNGNFWYLSGGTGGGETVIQAQAGEALSQNDLVYIATAADSGRTPGSVYKVDPKVDTRIDYIGFVADAVSLGQTASIKASGLVETLSSLTEGEMYYADPTTPGAITATQPTTASYWIIPVGIASSTTSLIINPMGSSSAVQIKANPNPNTVFNFDGSDAALWSTGNNATFLGGGSLVGTFVSNTSSPLQGISDYLYTQASGSLNDYIAAYEKPVDPRFRGKQVTIYHPFLYDGDSNDIRVVFYDATNGVEIPSSVYIQAASSISILRTNLTIPLTCESIIIGYQTVVENVGAVFEFDSIQLTSDTTIMAPIANVYSTVTLTGNTVSSDGTFRTTTVDSSKTMGPYSNYLSISDDATNGTIYTIKKNCRIDVTVFSLRSAATIGDVLILRDGTTVSYNRERASSATIPISASYQADFLGGQTFNCADGSSDGTQANVIVTITISEISDNILTVPETFSTDTANLTWANAATYDPTTLASAPIGTYITFTYASGGNTRVQTTGTDRPTQTDADMNVNGIQLFTRAYNASSTFGNPSAFAIQIGKNLSGPAVEMFGLTGKIGEIDYSVSRDSTNEYGARVGYSPTTGVLTVDAGRSISSTNTSRNFLRVDQITLSTSGYVSIKASKNPAMTGIDNTLIPAGIVMPFAGTTAPYGYLACDGSAVSRFTYSRLFNVLGVSHGQGDGSTTFNLPDYRGRFLRGVDGGAGNDPDAGTRTAMNTGGNTGDAVGSIQDDQFASHTHNVTVSWRNDNHFHENTDSMATRPTIPSGTRTYAGAQSSGGTETRPINAYINYIIKF